MKVRVLKTKKEVGAKLKWKTQYQVKGLFTMMHEYLDTRTRIHKNVWDSHVGHMFVCVNVYH